MNDIVPEVVSEIDRRAALCARVFLLAAVPIMLVLAFLIGPFGAADEREHFLRAVGIASGAIVPEVSYDARIKRKEKRVAGARIDTAAISVADKAALSQEIKQEQVNPHYRMPRADFAARLSFHQTGKRAFAEHNNTALYSPLLYFGPVIGIELSSLLDLPVFTWMYVGRVANVLLAGALIWWGIRRSRGSAPLLLVAGTLPIVLFQSATVSADALLLPITIMFAAILSRWADRAVISRNDLLLLSAGTLVIAVGKVAYLPLAILPPLIAAIVDRRWSPRLTLLLCVSLVAVVLWAAWAYFVRDKVFSMLDDIVVNPAGQLRQMIDHPVRTVVIFVHTMKTQIVRLLLTSTGSLLGNLTIRLPAFFGPASLLVLAIASVTSLGIVRRPLAVAIVAAGIALTCYVVIYLLLYLQFNAIGSPWVNGAQGRYLTPLMVVVLALLPGLVIRTAWSDRLLAVLIGWSGLSCLLTLWAVLHRYWL